MNVVNVRVDRISYRLSGSQNIPELRESIAAAVRDGGGFVRLDTEHGGEVFVMCSAGVSIVVSAVEQVHSVEAGREGTDAAGLLYDPLFDHLI